MRPTWLQRQLLSAKTIGLMETQTFARAEPQIYVIFPVPYASSHHSKMPCVPIQARLNL